MADECGAAGAVGTQELYPESHNTVLQERWNAATVLPTTAVHRSLCGSFHCRL
ncbi:hypothetical protein NHJ6243_005799 [Beauveria neobassiana]